MKTRFKILLVVASFIAFYFALIPVLQSCNPIADSDCTVWQELMHLTRPVITSSSHVWDTGDGIDRWTGTIEEMQTTLSLEDQVVNNLPFVTSMLVLPFVIIGFVVIWDKRQ